MVEYHLPSLHTVCNIVEDEYIERQLHKTCAGYVHYIEACKEHYFADSGIADVDLNDFTEIVNTLLLLVRYPAKLDADRRKKHGKHIRVFMAELKKGIENRANTINCITNIFKYLMNVANELSPEEGITDDMMKDMKEDSEASMNKEEEEDKKEKMEEFLLNQDWDERAKTMLERKDEWHGLGFFEQSDWKTQFFGIDKERFKMVLWK